VLAIRETAIAAAIMFLSSFAQAEVVSSSDNHYVLKHQASSVLSREELWSRLIEPSTWWHPDHTYSGDSKNLSLDLQAGGLWREDWDGNSVLHGSVLTVIEGEMLRLDAPFGPLQSMAVNTVWTISIKSDGEKSLVVFEELANGTDTSGLDELAKAVDFVKSEALSRLVMK